MADPEVIARLSAVLVARAGGYLRNTVRQEQVTCAVCATPVAGFGCATSASRYRGRPGLPDAAGFLTYAVAGRQSGYVMQGYKARPPVPEHRTIVSLLVLLALARHAGCAGRAGGPAPAVSPVTHWSTVPSLPARPGEHPLHAIVRRLAPGGEAVLAAADEVEYPRGVDPGHFRAAPAARGRARAARGRHVGARRPRPVRGPGLTGGRSGPRVRCSWPPAGSTRTSAGTRRSCAGSRRATTTRRSAPGPAPPAHLGPNGATS